MISMHCSRMGNLALANILVTPFKRYLFAQSCHKISQCLKAIRLGGNNIILFCNLTGASPTPLSRCPTNVRAIRQLEIHISRLQNCVRFGSKKSAGLVNAGPGFMTRVVGRVIALYPKDTENSHSVPDWKFKPASNKDASLLGVGPG